MTLNDYNQRNDRGRLIEYTVFDAKTKAKLFAFGGKRFCEATVRNECVKRGITTDVLVKWETNNRWGYEFKERIVTASKKSKEE
jgi:hypothetical protein